jgi:hypothetical protein
MLEPNQNAAPNLKPELQTFHDQFRSIRGEAERLVSGLTDDQFNWRPAPDRWSVAQCLDHLNVAGFLLLPRLETAIHRARAMRWMSDKPLRYGWVGNWFINSQEPGPNMRKVKTFKSFLPSSRAAIDEVLPRFQRLQDQFIAAVEDAEGVDLSRIKVTSPITSLLRLNVGAWFAATTAHERRHLVQAQAVKQAEGFPAL